MTPAQFEYVHKKFVRELKDKDLAIPSRKETKLLIGMLGLHSHGTADHVFEHLVEEYFELLNSSDSEGVKEE